MTTPTSPAHLGPCTRFRAVRPSGRADKWHPKPIRNTTARVIHDDAGCFLEGSAAGARTNCRSVARSGPSRRTLRLCNRAICPAIDTETETACGLYHWDRPTICRPLGSSAFVFETALIMLRVFNCSLVCIWFRGCDTQHTEYLRTDHPRLSFAARRTSTRSVPKSEKVDPPGSAFFSSKPVNYLSPDIELSNADLPASSFAVFGSLSCNWTNLPDADSLTCRVTWPMGQARC